MHVQRVMNEKKDVPFSRRKTLSELWSEMNKRYAKESGDKTINRFTRSDTQTGTNKSSYQMLV